MAYVGLWNKTVHVIDTVERKISQSLIALTDSIKTLVVTPKWIFVAGADPVIRAWDHKLKKVKEYVGHKGWVYALKVHEDILFSGGDDKTVRVWDIESAALLDTLTAHDNGVTALEIAYNELFSGSYDHTIICWDIEEIRQQIEERKAMEEEEEVSKSMELYYKKKAKKKSKKTKSTAKKTTARTTKKATKTKTVKKTTAKKAKKK
eukprot:TRINITY_DN7000_c0_g1_i2.p1 TRINITY_DN7000_c0_g1~~TRINITY_DN7000_c0_g1_i2.p1  ORF type:complete len:206 (-),score=50.23 TRINITY_DN7000_c0_g1_i2:128-745(-)